jgi:hypothetical protein
MTGLFILVASHLFITRLMFNIQRRCLRQEIGPIQSRYCISVLQRCGCVGFGLKSQRFQGRLVMARRVKSTCGVISTRTFDLHYRAEGKVRTRRRRYLLYQFP